jgi:hypothetical protein
LSNNLNNEGFKLVNWSSDKFYNSLLFKSKWLIDIKSGLYLINNFYTNCKIVVFPDPDYPLIIIPFNNGNFIFINYSDYSPMFYSIKYLISSIKFS